MKNPKYLGRPPKYRALYACLEDDVLYGPASVADLGIETGFILSKEPSVIDQERLRIRVATRHCFQTYLPDNGDGIIIFKGSSSKGWYGRTIKRSLGLPFGEDTDLP